jgi:hypothetical protein
MYLLRHTFYGHLSHYVNCTFELWILLNSRNKMLMCNNLAGTCGLQFQYTTIFPTDQILRTGAEETA